MKKKLLLLAMSLIGAINLYAQCIEIAPWHEDFNNGIPSCWSESSTSGGDWKDNGVMYGNMQPTYDHTSGNSNTDFVFFQPTYGATDVVLESPEIDVTALTTPTLRFWLRSFFPSYQLSQPNSVHVEVFNGTSYVQIDSIVGDYGSVWKQFNYDLSAYTYGSNLVKFRLRGNVGGYNYQFNQMAFDDVEVYDLATFCLEPLDLTFTSSTANTATFTWADFTGTPGNYIIEYFNINSLNSLGNVVVNGALTGTLTGIASNGFYEARVRKICAAGDTSVYSDVVDFHTFNLGTNLDYDFQPSPLGYVDITDPANEVHIGINNSYNYTLTRPIYVEGNRISEISIAENGAVLFDNYNSSLLLTNGLLDASSKPGVYGLWDQLSNGGFYIKEQGVAPNRVLIITFDNREYLPAVNGIDVDFQFQFHEAMQEIYVVYEDVEFGGSGSDGDFGAGATLGFVGPNTIQQVSYDSDVVLSHHNTIRYFYTDCPNIETISATSISFDAADITWTTGNSSSTTFTVEWGPEGFTPGNGTGTTTVNTNAATLTGLNQLTDYQVYVYADCGASTSTGRDFHFQTKPICATPYGLSGNITQDSLFATWNWIAATSSVNVDDFTLAYTTVGDSPYNGTMYSTGLTLTDTIIDPSIMLGAVYDVYIQANCSTGDTSLLFGPITTVSPLYNDSICYAQNLAVNDQVNVFTNLSATQGPIDAYIIPPVNGYTSSFGWGNNATNRSTWFTFVAPASGNVKISGYDYGYLGKTAVYEMLNCDDTSTYTLLGANDNDVLSEGAGSATNWVMCGLTPGNTYYLGHFAQANYTAGGLYSIRLTEVDYNAGSLNGAVKICKGDTLDLYTTLASYDDVNSTWQDMANTNQLYANEFASTLLSGGVYPFVHHIEYGCYEDTLLVNVEVFEQAEAGTNGSITACMNNPLILTDALSGDINIDGTWYDYQDNAINGLAYAPNIPGQFNYDYVVGNGVCPNDTATVLVVVDPTCNYLGTEEFEANTFKVYPNPASTSLTVLSNENYDEMTIEIVDLGGRVVFSDATQMSAGVTRIIDVSTLTKGLYMINVYNATQSTSFKIVIE